MGLWWKKASAPRDIGSIRLPLEPAIYTLVL